MSGLDPFNSLLQDSGGLSNEDYGSLEPEVDEDYEEWKRFKKWKEAKAKALESATALESASMKPAKPVDTKAGLAGVSYLSNDPHRAPQDELGKLSTAAGIASESAEAKRREAVAENDAGKFTEYLDGLDKAIDYNTELYEQVRKQTLEAFKAGKIDAATFNQRNLLLTGEDGKGGYKASLEADRARTAEARAELSKVRLDQAVGTPEEIWQGLPTNVRDTLGLAGRASQWSPVKTALDMLRASQEQLAGGASYVAESLGKLLPGPSVFSDSNIDVGLKDLANSAGGLGLDPDNPLRQRGREFNEKVGSALQAGGFSPIPPMLRDMLPGTEDQKDRAEASALSTGFELTTDPLNVVDFGGVPVLKSMGKAGKLVAASKAGQKFAGLFPDVVRKAADKTGLGAKKFAAWWQGDGVRAGVMDTPFEDLYHAQRAREAGINYDLDVYQTKLAEDAARILNGVPEDKAAELQGLAPLLTERRGVKQAVEAGEFVITDPRIASLPPEDRKVLFELAENLGENFDQVRQLENSKWLLDTPDLMGPFDYHGREYTDEVMQKIAESPTARRVLEAEKMKFNSDAAMTWEQERKLREFDHFGAAAKVRDALRRDGVKIADTDPVWRTDTYQQLSERAARSANAAKDNRMYNHFTDMFGETPNGVDGLRVAGVADYGKHVGDTAPTPVADTMPLELRQKRLNEAIEAERAAKPADYVEIDGFHGTNRPFDEFQVDAPRLAVKDKPGRGAPVRGVFFAPNKDVPANYVGVTFEDVAKEAVKRDKTIQLWPSENVAAHFQKATAAGVGPTRWARSLADEVFKGGRGARVWLREQMSKLLGREPKRGVSVIIGGRESADGFRKGGAVYDFAPDAMDEFAEVAAAYAKRDPSMQGFSIVPHTASLKPRIVQHKLRGRMVDLTDPAKWPEDLLAAMRKSRDSEDARVLRAVEKAKVGGAWRGKEVIERSPALQKWLGDKGYDIVKKPEYDDITGDFSYWALNDRALGKAPLPPTKRLGLLETEAGKVGDELAKARAGATRGLRPTKEAPDPIAYAKNYAKAHLAPIRGKSTALEIMEAHKLQLPDNINEAMRLATTYVDPDDAKRFVRLAEDMGRIRAYEPKRFWRVYDVLKGIYQRTTLGRVSSLTKDMIGTAINLAMGGGADRVPQAIREVGSFQNWQKGMGHSDLTRRLRAEGYLQTTRNEALERGQMKGIAGELRAEGKLKWAKAADVVGRVENKGVLGSLLPTRKGKALGGETVTEATDVLNDFRVYSEEMGRVSTYLDAVAKGASHEEAIEKGLSVWGKFDELTKLDRKYLNRIFFFRAWWQRSIPITLRHIVERPVRSKLLLSMMAGDSQEEGNQYPDWLKRIGGVALGKDGDRVKVLSLGGSSYFSPAFSLLQGDMARALYKGDPLGAASGAMGDTLRASPPFVHSIGELAQKRDYFSNKDWWRDMNTRTGSNIQAPGFLHFLKDTSLGELMNLKEDTKSGKVTINPYYAWAFGIAPGSEPLAQDASSFTNVKDGSTPLKGFARQLGVPVYDVPLVDDRTQAIREMRGQMKKTVDDLSGHALSITDYGDVIVSDRTERGEKMRDDVARWKEEAKAQGLPESSERFQKYVDDKMRDNYLSEWKLIELSRYLKRWESALRNGKDDPGLKYEPVKIGISTKKFVEQGRKEKLRSLRSRLTAP